MDGVVPGDGSKGDGGNGRIHPNRADAMLTDDRKETTSSIVKVKVKMLIVLMWTLGEERKKVVKEDGQFSVKQKMFDD